MKTFWLILTIAGLIWYIVVTAYVSFHGVTDIKNMLNRLKNKSD